MSARLAEQVAIVTGATRGIGEGIARAMHREGARVILSGRDAATGQSLAADLNADGQGRARFVAADVSDREAVVNLKDQALAAFGRVDVLVNNAGVNAPFPMAKLPLAAWHKVMNIDLMGVLHGLQVVGPLMIAQHSGSIINLASISARYAFPDGGAYGPAKAAVVMLTKQCAMEWGCHGVRVNAISPGLIRTPLSENIYRDPANVTAREAVIPLRRIGTPADVAGLAVFLASQESSYITGQDILIDGGLTDAVFQALPGRATIKEPM